MIFIIELPFSLNKTRIGNRIRAYDVRIQIQEAKKHGSGSIYSFSTDILYHFSPDWGFREKLTKFCENCDTFCKSVRFRERSKSVFVPILVRTCFEVCTLSEKGYIA
jgi:hypothetical protein